MENLGACTIDGQTAFFISVWRARFIPFRTTKTDILFISMTEQRCDTSGEFFSRRTVNFSRSFPTNQQTGKEHSAGVRGQRTRFFWIYRGLVRYSFVRVYKYHHVTLSRPPYRIFFVFVGALNRDILNGYYCLMRPCLTSEVKRVIVTLSTEIDTTKQTNDKQTKQKGSQKRCRKLIQHKWQIIIVIIVLVPPTTTITTTK